MAERAGSKFHARRRFLKKPSCQQGDECRTWFTCEREHAFPAVDHSKDDCDLDYLLCIAEHYRHECAHDFRSGPVVEWETSNGGHVTTSSCQCGLTSFSHDMAHSP